MILEALIRRAETDLVCAVDEYGEKMTFSCLHERSDALASYFLEELSPKAPVILVGDKENDMLTAIFACMKSGRAYVPLTPQVPEKRASFIANNAEGKIILAFNTHLLMNSPIKRLDEKALSGIIEKRLGVKIPRACWLGYDDMMALLYTSGSTGTPKGVINSLGDLENLLQAPEKYYIGGPGMRVMNNFSYMFSAHMQHVFRTMIIMGSEMHAVPAQIMKDPGKLVDLYCSVRPDYIGVIATSCAMLLSDSRFSEEYLPDLKGIALAGEVCARKLVTELFLRFPRISIIIQYASTELTTVALGIRLQKEDLDRFLSSDMIPIGRPVPVIEARLWDEEGKEVSDGEKGELIIISKRLSDGYWKLPQETGEAFFMLPDRRRGFRTRDLMIRRNGLYYYAGRLDNRIKIGGNRVELEEVETAAAQLPEIRQCAVRPVYGEDERVASLTAYVTLREGVEDSLRTVIAIKQGLKNVLPQYMIPQKIRVLAEFKTNTSGKIDRGALRILHEEETGRQASRLPCS